ncbi:MAG: tetratricopeptide repeat protein [Nitrospirota bacterium]
MSSENKLASCIPDAKNISLFFLVAAASFLCFLPTLNNGFLYTWDDGVYIVYNDNLSKSPLELVRWAFSTFYADYWAPLTWLSLAMDRAVWGLNPAGYHLTNTLLHAMNAGLFFLLCLSLFKRYLSVHPVADTTSTVLINDRPIYCAFLAALFFAIHPLRVESVAWLSERKDVLSFFFGIAAVLLYVRYTEDAEARSISSGNNPAFMSSKYYWLSAASLGLSLLSKPMFVTLPIVLLVLDWFPLKRLQLHAHKGVLLEKAPFLLLSGMASVITTLVHSSTLVPVELSPISTRVLVAGKAVISYLRLTMWPANLNPFSLHPGVIQGMGLEYGMPLLLFMTISVCCALSVKRLPVLMASWLIYVITLFPVLGLVQGGLTDIADRFTYVPGLPLALLTALGITTIIAKLSASRTAVIIISAATALLLLTASYLTVRQISHWKDDVTLWSRAIDAKPHSSGRAYYQRAKGYALKGDYRNALTDINEAIAIAAQKKLREMFNLYRERARILRNLGDLDGAIADYTRALSSDTSPSRSLYYRERGKLYLDIGRPDLANEDFKMADPGR